MNKTLICILIIAIYFTCNLKPFVIHDNKECAVYLSDSLTMKLNPLANFNFLHGQNRATLIFTNEDLEISPFKNKKSRAFECNNNLILEDLKNNFVFSRSNGDMATCESRLYIYQNNVLIFCSAIVVENDMIGIQNQWTGWAVAVYQDKLHEIFMKFKSVYRPIVVI